MHTILGHWADRRMGNGVGWAEGTPTDHRYWSVRMGSVRSGWADRGNTDIAEWAKGTAHQCWYNYVGGSNMHRKYENSSSTSRIF